jgi:tetratricopeptide (TPR) repeat protein
MVGWILWASWHALEYAERVEFLKTHISKRLRKFLTRDLFFAEKIKNVDVRHYVPTYGAAGFTSYVSISSDQRLGKSIKPGAMVLITGRSGIGKSRAALRHVKAKYSDWTLLCPSQEGIRQLTNLRLPRGKYVLFLDDIERFLGGASTSGLQDVIESLSRLAHQLIVLATLKTHGPALQTIGNDPLWLNRWETIELPVWTNEQARTVSRETKVPLVNFDGTPLSVIRPSSGMRILYLGLDNDSKALLRSLKFLRSIGLKPVSVAVLRATYCSTLFGREGKDFGNALMKVQQEGFLSRCDSKIEAYDPFLDQISDWSPEPENIELAIDIFAKNELTNDLLLLGQHQDRAGKTAIAERAFSTAVALDPSFPRTHYSLGLFSFRRHDFVTAEKYFLEATRLAPKWEWPWVRLASTYQKLGNPAKRRDAIGHIVLLKRKLPSLTRKETAFEHCLVANAFWQDGLVEESLAEYRAAVEMDDQLAAAFYGMGRIFSSRSEWAEAERSFKEAIRLAPRWAQPHLGIAEPLRRRGDLDLAAAEVRKAIKLSPAFHMAYLVLDDILLQSEKYSEAIGVLHDAISRFPSSAQLYSLLGEVYSTIRRNAQARDAYKTATELDPEYAEGYVGLAKEYRLLKQIDFAIEANNKAILLRPNFAEPYFGLGLCLLKNKGYDAGERNLRKAIELKPEFKEAHYYLGLIFERKKQFEDALTYVDQAIALGLGKQNVYQTQARIRRRLGRSEDAKKIENTRELGDQKPETPIENTPETRERMAMRLRQRFD